MKGTRRNMIILALGLGLLSPGQASRRERNLVPNPSFEQVRKDGTLAGWTWHSGRAQAVFTVDATVARSGQRAVKIVNPTPMSPHVYSYLDTYVALQPNTTYTLSCYVKSEAPGVAWIGGGHQWRLRFHFPATGGEWQRVVGTFTTRPEETNFQLMILSESPTPGLWIDDVQLERGEEATEFVLHQPLSPGETRLFLDPLPLLENLVPNSSFEIVDGNRPKHWMWDQRNTDATMSVDETVARSGRRSVRFTNSTPFGPHVYGWFGIVGGLPVKPNTTYTVSCYVKGDRLGVAWIGGGQGWRIRVLFPGSTGGRWLRVSRTFTTQEDETNFPFMILTESPTEPFWVDDVQLVEGLQAVPYLPEEGKTRPCLELEPRLPRRVPYRGMALLPVWCPSKYPLREVSFIGQEFWAEGLFYTPEPLTNAQIKVEVLNAEGQVLAQAQRTLDLPAGGQAIEFGWGVGETAGTQATLRGTVTAGGRTLARSESTIRLITGHDVEQALRRDGALLAQLRRKLEALRQAGRDPSYPLVTATVLENFIGYARED
ncbi:MAG TPA: hypothetical protein EYP85_12865 [Armatimonadetes bacterium]|nr:hypothetical protein [Armatimonadota bacterium]